MLRPALNDAMKNAMKAKDQRALSTVRLILAALKDRDIAVRSAGTCDPIPDSAILEMLQKMVKQRHESIEMYTKGNRPELAQQEREEIGVIEGFMPKQMGEAEMSAAVDAAIAAVGAAGIKDMGKVMASLKQEHAGVMDFAKAGGLVKQKLSA